MHFISKSQSSSEAEWSLCQMNQQDILTSNENLIYVSSEYLLVIYFGLFLFLTGLAPRKCGSSGKGASHTRPFCPQSPPWQLGPGLLPCGRLQGGRNGAGRFAWTPVSVSSSPHWSYLPSGCLGVSGQSGVFNCRLRVCLLLGRILKF